MRSKLVTRIKETLDGYKHYSGALYTEPDPLIPEARMVIHKLRVDPAWAPGVEKWLREGSNETRHLIQHTEQLEDKLEMVHEFLARLEIKVVPGDWGDWVVEQGEDRFQYSNVKDAYRRAFEMVEEMLHLT